MELQEIWLPMVVAVVFVEYSIVSLILGSDKTENDDE